MMLEIFFIAGHSARWMFHFGTARAMKDADYWLSRVGNKEDLIGGLQGTGGLLAVNHLLSKVGGKIIIVSEYVIRSLMWDCDVEIMKTLTSYSKD